jgi:hypothetical protein
MEWTDTLILEPRTAAEAKHSVVDGVQITPVQDATLLHAKARTHKETETVLKLLRGFRTAGRRVVLCDTSCLSDDYHTVERQLGHTLVETGHAELLVSCGLCGREVAIGARDEGLELANVVVCGDARSACEVLAYRVQPGDAVLLLGVGDDTRARLVMSLNNRLSRPAVAA